MLLLLAGCATDARMPSDGAAALVDSVAVRFANTDPAVAYVGDASCNGCHADAAAAYTRHSMARSFHRWSAEARVESTLVAALRHAASGYRYRVIDSAGALWQVEEREATASTPTHTLRRRVDYVMGSGRLARTYFTEENGRLFQLPLTWYADHGWDFSPGYELNNARFSRVLPDRCIACHASYPVAAPHLEGKYPELRPGIGCERCHGPGSLHVARWQGSASRLATTLSVPSRAGGDSTIVNPSRLPLERRLDVCEQCHVHTAVAVLREGRTAFDYTPAQELAAQYAYYRTGTDIDVVSHADRLRQSACFRASADTERPLECATCHDPHGAPASPRTRNASCLSCHDGTALVGRFPGTAPARSTHAAPGSDCVGCHMPVVKERTVPHGSFSDHWIRVPGRDSTPAVSATQGPAVVPYFARDRTGPEAPVYQAIATVVFASLAADGRLFDEAAAVLSPLLFTGAANAYPQAHFLLGVAHQARGRFTEARSALRRSVALDSQRPDVWRALAQAQWRSGELRDARSSYERALALQPALAWIRAEYADLLQQEGAMPDAIRAYRAAVLEQPSLGAAWFNLATALLALDSTAAAVAAFEEAVRLDPAHAEAVTSLFVVETSRRAVKRLSRYMLPPGVARGDSAGAGAMSFTVEPSGARALSFRNVPPDAFVLVYTPDGTLLLAVPTGAGGTTTWDVRAGDGAPLGPGLYRAEVQGRTVARPLPTRWFGLVRR
jgi:Tfp pilus assembly protein PilF